MNIVYLIGNGFDLNVGLKTSSRDFINFVNNNKTQEKYSEYCTYLNELSEKMSENSELWSDYERALGLYSEYFNDSDKEKNIIDYYNRIDALNMVFIDFLTEQENISKKLVFDERHTIKFANALLGACSDKIFESEKTKFEKVYDPIDTVSVSIINFNYTTVIDRFIENTFGSDEVKALNIQDKHTTLYLSNHIHIHGTINDNTGMIIGVDNPDQISNKQLRSESDITNSLVKPRMNSRLGNMKAYNCKNIILNADIICVYGMSFGITDLT